LLFLGLHLGDVDVEVADRIATELGTSRLVAVGRGAGLVDEDQLLGTEVGLRRDVEPQLLGGVSCF
jgi:hypothetical protein